MIKNGIMVIGEAWGEEEAKAGKPFVGKSGWLIKQLLSQSGISLDDCYVTNVFNFQPRGNDLTSLCNKKSEGGTIPGMGPLAKGKYLRNEFAPELKRLYEEINRENPNLILALGATAAWATIGSSGIRAIRGASIGTTSPASGATGLRLSRTFKVLPTYHPTAVLREWSLRPIVLADLDKARRYAATPDIVRPSRDIWVEPDLYDLGVFEEQYIRPATRLSIDIETKGDQITCIGFAPNPEVAIVIPFWSRAKPDGNYWPTLSEELKAWGYVKKWCSWKPTLFQNGMFDAHRLWRTYGIPCTQMEHDTMLLHHAMQPEMEKGLGFLGSVYTDEQSWKFMHKTDTLKKGDE